MADSELRARKETLDKDLDKLVSVEEATSTLSRTLVAPGLGLLFLALAAVLASLVVVGEPGALLIVAAAAIGAYMALNIGANDVANNVGPAVGARALSLGGALVIAAVFESAGALLAGGEVVNTIAKGIIAPEAVGEVSVFVRAMMAALISAALWINLATWIGAPVSTTHAIVGGVMGAGIAAAGFGAVTWPTMAAIAASWVISPVLGGVVAAGFLAFVKTTMIYQDDKIAAARRWIPLLIAIMAGAFAGYLAIKGLGKVTDLGPGSVLGIAVAAFVLAWLISSPAIRHQSEGMENRNQSLRRLFHLPLAFSAALLSFAHGANDVANAIGPLAAIVFAAQTNVVGSEVTIPLWVMLIGAFGISLGLMLFGPRLIRMVGSQITRLNPMRAFCVALSAAITVIIASALGLPVSSTHITVGAVFGVGFFREWYTARSQRRRDYLARRGALNINNNNNGSAADDEEDDEAAGAPARARASPSQEAARRKLVRRAHVTTIVAAWVITVPAAAIIAALAFAVFGLVG
ncbi:inorganic phosphate transporter [Aquibium sp. A9E412]|uniref:inorganic phosphate transporter n=1 Tax=Aquibium sp. A9E412 TaxID=2976767 RepID=UPI0025AEF537|nr:inorganic phosphate transporter [Aquibium sp. A9E412]MDN2565972.1 inorganic phosphate transporter [Aquibium sp. A9E412]